MAARGTKPTEGPKHHRGKPQVDWTEVEDKPFRGKVPVKLPAKRDVMTQFGPKSVDLRSETKAWWAALRRMPHCVLWAETDWVFALTTALVADMAFRGVTGAATELRNREKVLGTTVEYRRDLRIRYVKPGGSRQGASPAKAPAATATPAGVTSLADRRRRLTS